MAEDELAACRKEIDDLRGKLRRLVPEWKNLKIVVQKLTASEAAAVARAEQLAHAANLSPSSNASASDDAAVLRAKLRQLVPDWKRLKEANKSLAESESASRLQVQELQSQLEAAHIELEQMRDTSAKSMELESELHAARNELDEMRQSNWKLEQLESKLNAASVEAEEASNHAQELETKLHAAYIELEKLPEAQVRIQELESELETASFELEKMRESSQESLKYSEVIARLENQVEQQDGEIAALKRRLEKAMQRPTKLELQKVKHENVQLRKQLSVEADVVRALQNDIAELKAFNEKTASLSDDLADLQSRFSICQASRDSLMIDGDKLEAENRMLHLQIDQLLQESPEELKELKDLFKDGLSEGKSLISVIQEELANLNERIQACLIEKDNIISELDDTKLELRAAHYKNEELMQQLQSLQSSFDDEESEFTPKDQDLQTGAAFAQGTEAHISDDKAGVGEPDEMENPVIQVHNESDSDSDKFHQYQNRIELLEEELLELSAANSHLRQILSFTNSELQSCQDSFDQSSSEADLLLQLLSQKDHLMEDLSSQLNELRAYYGEKVQSLKGTISTLRKHNDGLQELLNVEASKSPRRYAEDDDLILHKPVSEAEQQSNEQDESLESETTLKPELEATKLRMEEQKQELRDAQAQLSELKQELHSSQMRIDEKDNDLKLAHARIESQEHDLERARGQIDKYRLELEDALRRVDEQGRQLEAALVTIDEQRLKLEDAQTKIEQHARELEIALVRFDEQHLELESARSQIDDHHREMDVAQQQIVDQRCELEAAQMRIDEQYRELSIIQSQISEQSRDLEAAQRRIEEQRELGQAIVHSYNELRGHYELLMVKVEADTAILEQITRSQSSRSLSPKKSLSGSADDSFAAKPVAPVRNASVPVKKRRNLKDFLIKLFERPIYDENGKPISRVDLTEDTEFVWDPVKKKYIDLNAPETEQKPIAKPPPRPAFAPSTAPAPSASLSGIGPPPRKPTRSLTSSRYALPEVASDARTSPRPSTTAVSHTANVSNVVSTNHAISGSSSSSSSSSSFSYRPPVINSFQDVIVVTSDYHSLVASLLALQKDLSHAKRAKLETDLHVSTLVRQIKQRLAKAPLEPTPSESMEMAKLVYCILAITGIVSALTKMSV